MIITAKRAAEICREWYVAFSRMGKYKEKCVLELLDAADTIEALEAAQPKWISVKDRLPEEGETVLCYYESDLIGVCTRLHKIWEDSYGYWESDDAITHWMPLPEPPNEVEI